MLNKFYNISFFIKMASASNKRNNLFIYLSNQPKFVINSERKHKNNNFYHKQFLTDSTSR